MADFELDNFLTLPRVGSLTVSGDDRLVVSVAQPDVQQHRYVSALWEVRPDTSPRRLTWSGPGESAAAFAPDGSLVFLSGRLDPDMAPEAAELRGEAAALWSLPAGGGEAQLLAAPPGGADSLKVARDAGTVVFGAKTHPGTDSWDADLERERARKDAEVKAQLFTDYPIRYWDDWLGPRHRHLYTLVEGRPVDLLPAVGGHLQGTDFDVSPDGRTVVTGWRTDEPDLRERAIQLHAVDLATGERRVLLAGRNVYVNPAVSPDGTRVAVVRERLGDPTEPHRLELVVVGLDGSEEVVLAGELDLWPQAPAWTPDSGAVFFTADHRGSGAVVRVDLDSGETRLLATDGAYSHLHAGSDGARLFALRSTIGEPERVVILDASTAEQAAEPVATPGDEVAIPGTVARVAATARDGVEVGSWLVLPDGASADSPAPLVVFIHGGPLGSWNAWHWRWNPHVLAQQGYAVLLPDPALSTGYGQDFIARGWGRWGAEPYTDLIAAVDAAIARADIDADRTAAMGGSFGGYLANWVAGQTDRFDAIITHASLWDLERFHGTTDVGVWWEMEFGDPYTDPARYREHSPRRHVAQIRTPMLVIHGELDYRVPISEALTLWTDLRRHGVESQLLYFPDENHWVLKPQNARVWYAAVLAFLDHHMLGKDWERPDLL